MTENITTPNGVQPTPQWTALPSFTPPQPAKRRPVARVLAGVLAVALVAALVGLYLQHKKTVQVDDQLGTTQHSLSDTRADLKASASTLAATKDHLSTASNNLDAANDQLDTCKQVGRATLRLFSSTRHLLDYAIADSYDMPSITAAGNDVDAVSRLVKSNGFENIQDFVGACSGTPDNTI